MFHNWLQLLAKSVLRDRVLLYVTLGNWNWKSPILFCQVFVYFFGYFFANIDIAFITILLHFKIPTILNNLLFYIFFRVLLLQQIFTKQLFIVIGLHRFLSHLWNLSGLCSLERSLKAKSLKRKWLCLNRSEIISHRRCEHNR